MIQNLFSSQIWKANLDLNRSNIKENILNQIEKNYQDNKFYTNKNWECNIHTTISENNNIDYSEIVNHFINEYQYFTKQNNLKVHNFSVTNIWYNYYLFGSNQEIHTHVSENNLYSAVFFLKINDSHPKLTFYNYTNYNAYFNLNQKIKNLYDKGNINHSIISNYFSLDCKENDFVIFPSYLPHCVFIQKNNEPRITISMNFSLN